MKKKIGELTLREVNKICSKHKHCEEDCPFFDINFICKVDFGKDKNPFYEEEIEVEENEKENKRTNI